MTGTIYKYRYIYRERERGRERTNINLLLKVSPFFHNLQVKKRETLSSKFIVVLFILPRIILSSILYIEHC